MGRGAIETKREKEKWTDVEGAEMITTQSICMPTADPGNELEFPTGQLDTAHCEELGLSRLALLYLRGLSI